jgi:hypothetical protein
MGSFSCYLLFLLSINIFALSSIEQAWGNVRASELFCQKYTKAGGCESQAQSCKICHTGPPAYNSYGTDLSAKLSGSFEESFFMAVEGVEQLDSDKDGVSNREELENYSFPGNTDVKPLYNNKLVYDFEVAYRRVVTIYCGETVTYVSMQNLKAISGDQAKHGLLHQKLSQCLESSYWKNDAIPRLADPKIQPIAAVGFGGNVVIGDYRWDYWLFKYVMTSDRDVRDLLLAQYHVDANGSQIQGVVPREEPFQFGTRIVIAGGQPLQANRRAGLLTTQWFISSNTMFAMLPRNTAAQAYRAYLGLDLAKGEGLHPITGEPKDVDGKNVKQGECAVCHSTLDPLSYAFSTYRGIEISTALALGNPIGTYNANRTPWEAQGYLFGNSVPDLLSWAKMAAQSEAFQKNIARMMFVQAMNREPLPHEKSQFDLLWKNLPEDGYSVNKMLHRLVDTMAFGGKNP